MATLADTGNRPSVWPAWGEYRFFAILATIMAGLVFAAFSTQLAAGRSTFGAPLRVHIHAIAFMGWVVLFLTQSWLGARRSLALHRKLGWIATGWMVAMLGAASWIIVAISRHATVPFFFQPQQFLIFDPAILLGFVGMTVWAIRRRAQTDWHARLHICAMSMLLSPAFGRLMPMPLLAPYAFEASYVAGLIFPIVGVIRDIRRHGRAHPAWLRALAVMLVVPVAIDAVAYSPIGASLYRTVTAGSKGATIDPLAFPARPDTPLLTGR